MTKLEHAEMAKFCLKTIMYLAETYQIETFEAPQFLCAIAFPKEETND